MAEWSDWFQSNASDIIGKWSSREFQQDPVPMSGPIGGQLGEQGYYIEGKAGATRAQAADAMSTEKKLLIGVGALVLLLVVMRA